MNATSTNQSGTGRSWLDAIEQRDYDVFTSRVRLSSWRKLLLVAQAVPIRLGLAK